MTEKTIKGRWKPGKSGNPAGRKPGTGQIAKLRAEMAEKLPEIVAMLVERALGAYFRPSWTAFQADRGQHFSVIVDGISG